VPVARKTDTILHAFDIEPSMIETARRNVERAGILNVRFHLADILEVGTQLEPGRVGLVLLFNILHFDNRRVLLQEASRILAPGGRIAIIHWRKDIPTPRGPSNELRPDEPTILNSVQGLELHCTGNGRILEPYHWGIQLVKEEKHKIGGVTSEYRRNESSFPAV
jgi:SAM-dependent methyltransferase